MGYPAKEIFWIVGSIQQKSLAGYSMKITRKAIPSNPCDVGSRTAMLRQQQGDRIRREGEKYGTYQVRPSSPDGFVDDYPSRLPVLCLSFASRPLLSICPILYPILGRSPLVCCSKAKRHLATTFSDGDLTRGAWRGIEENSGRERTGRIYGFLATRRPFTIFRGILFKKLWPARIETSMLGLLIWRPYLLQSRLRNAQGTHDRPYAENLRGKINSIPHSADMVKALLGFNSAEGMTFETRAQAEADHYEGLDHIHKANVQDFAVCRRNSPNFDFH
ncbi:hypothetical protein CVT26_002831 [Gymnopilus dilepis]|uniref:Uncharacterized protein n=1 Tax=Gymnopilus dilepis TaxID=231916 RepID=A0A409X5U9_9AGAR|nr:hypothetical protein CVT26_002831 [Gymnopilus dilepis]